MALAKETQTQPVEESKLTQSELNQYNNGVNQWYRHPLHRKFFYSDGIKFMADKAKAYWLIDAIASHQSPKLYKDMRLRDFQIWELKVDLEKGSAVLICKADLQCQPAVIQKIEATCFPLAELKLYVEYGCPSEDEVGYCLMLPSER